MFKLQNKVKMDGIQILTVYECEVEIYPQDERLDCSILRASRRVEWTIHLSPSGYHFNLHTNLKQLIFVLYESYINSITYLIIYVNFKMTFATNTYLSRLTLLRFKALTYYD